MLDATRVPDASTAADDSIELAQSRDKADWDAFVIKINKSLDNLDLEFRHLLDQSSGKEMYAVVGVQCFLHDEYILLHSLRLTGKAMI